MYSLVFITKYPYIDIIANIIILCSQNHKEKQRRQKGNMTHCFSPFVVKMLVMEL